MEDDAARSRQTRELRRRDLLKQAALAGVTASIATGDRAQADNEAGAADRPRPFIDAYPDQLSYAPGEDAALHVSTSAPRYSVAVTRLGARDQKVWSRENLNGADHPVPEQASMQGCEWPVAVHVPLAREWQSGYYRVELTGMLPGGQTVKNESFFVLRSVRPGKGAKILLQFATNTYQAYNQWGGSSLYSGSQFTQVSLNRPLMIREPPVRYRDDSFNPNYWCAHAWELPFIRWAEAAGYLLDYSVNGDLEFHPEILSGCRLVLSVGHDEFWSAPMRDNLEKFIAAGGNVAFMSGNTCCWQVRFEDHGRTMVCWKAAYLFDPVFKTGDHRLLSTLWCSPFVRRPENGMTGVGFVYGGYNGFFGEFTKGPEAGAYTVHRPDHWILADTGLKRGDEIGSRAGIVGYECDGCEFDMVEGLPVPTGRDGTPEDFQILATGTARWSEADGSLNKSQLLRALLHGGQPPEKVSSYKTRPGCAVLGTYTRGGTVFTTGSTDWAHGLASGDRIVDRITRNVLDRLST